MELISADARNGLNEATKLFMGVDPESMSGEKQDEAIAEARLQLARLVAIKNNTAGLDRFTITMDQANMWKQMFPFANFTTMVRKDNHMVLDLVNMQFIAFCGAAMSRVDIPTALYPTLPIYHYRAHFGPNVCYFENTKAASDMALTSTAVSDVVKAWTELIGERGMQQAQPTFPYMVDSTQYSRSFTGSHPHSCNTTSTNLHDLCVGNNRFRDYMMGQAKLETMMDMNSFMTLAMRWCQGANLSDMYGTPATRPFYYKEYARKEVYSDPDMQGWQNFVTYLLREASTALEQIAPDAQYLRDALYTHALNGHPNSAVPAEVKARAHSLQKTLRESEFLQFARKTVGTPGPKYWGADDTAYEAVLSCDRPDSEALLPLARKSRGSSDLFWFVPGVAVLRGLKSILYDLNSYAVSEDSNLTNSMPNIQYAILERMVGGIMVMQQKAYQCWLNLNQDRVCRDFGNFYNVSFMEREFFSTALIMDALYLARHQHAPATLLWRTPEIQAFATMPKNWNRLAKASGKTNAIPAYIAALD